MTPQAWPTPRLLLIDSHAEQRRALIHDLHAAGFEVLDTANGSGGLQNLLQHPDIIVLDPDLPDLSGEHVIARLRAATAAPILVVSEHDQLEEKVRCMDAGANDHLARPFVVAELLARIRVKLWRHSQTVMLRVGELEVSRAQRLAWFRGVGLDLTPTEFNVLTFLVEHAGEVVTREMVAQVIRPGGGSSRNAVCTHVGNIRQKLWLVGGHGVLRTAHGAGYFV